MHQRIINVLWFRTKNRPANHYYSHISAHINTHHSLCRCISTPAHNTYNVYFIHSHKSIKIIVGKFINSNKHVGVYSTEQRTLTLTKEEENNLIECHIWTTRSYGSFSKRSKVLKELENTLALHLMEFVFHSRLPLPSNDNKKTSNERRKHVIVSI